ncbi:crotonase/enoyl-CoA hydratase family protein [Nocardiopsis sp. RSe5-2]|uniref:Crotonase/enoyl-CoA hydratase family protein n=1 Tax=Nocardiopsis endophytica TaxID=3018445 RepID=A0ABT4U6Q7_9ACTN|nr:crotonase/enoyl-CoA hydratase family protein [Nocardiopsis endophytica]MDA2812643.1 crotonase/enoyl-CoA hydratase family protein [Nocardiopsis endophytica]
MEENDPPLTHPPLTPGAGIGSWPRRRARISPGSVALRQGGRALTYRELADRTDRLAAALAGLGVRHGDRVAYLGLNDTATFETMFAAQRAGAVFVPLNHRLAAAELDYMLADSGASVLVVGPGGEEPDERLRALDSPRRDVRHHLSYDELAARTPSQDASGAVSDAVPHDAVSMDDPALFLYTSGTTGRPKAAVLTHANLTWNTVNQLVHLDFTSTDLGLCIAPLFHAVGLGQISLPLLLKGGTVEVVPRFGAAAVLSLIEELRATCFSCVPTMMQMMAEDPRWSEADLSSLRLVLYGGSPMPAHVAAEWRRRGVPVLQGYGMTEAAPGVSMEAALPDGAPTAGAPHFFTDTALLGPDGVPAPAGSGTGELLVRGPNVFSGYWGRPVEEAGFLTDGGAPGGPGDWFRTGDVVRAGDGLLHVVDRVKDVYISGGENVYPAEVEAVLNELPEVAAAAVVGRPDERWGEAGVAFVEAAPGAAADPAPIREHLEARLARYKLPKEVVFVDELPRTASGKVLRHRLRAHGGGASGGPAPAAPAPALPGSLEVERRGPVAVLRLCRPGKRNALDDATVTGIGRFFSEPPDWARAAVLDAEGDHFCAGLDLSELGGSDVESGLRHSRMWHRAFAAVERGGLPVVAALKGAVIGGGLELAAAAHIRVADRTAFYALPEGQRGLFVGGGGSVRLPRLIGAHRMADLMLTGRVLDAEEGASAGLTQYLEPEGGALERAVALAGAAAANAPLTNFAVVEALPRIAEAAPEVGYLTEALMASAASSSAEAQRRMEDFLRKRAAKVQRNAHRDADGSDEGKGGDA